MSEGKCDLSDVEGIIDRVVEVSVMALTGREANGRRPNERCRPPHRTPS